MEPGTPPAPVDAPPPFSEEELVAALPQGLWAWFLAMGIWGWLTLGAGLVLLVASVVYLRVGRSRWGAFQLFLGSFLPMSLGVLGSIFGLWEVQAAIEANPTVTPLEIEVGKTLATAPAILGLMLTAPSFFLSLLCLVLKGGNAPPDHPPRHRRAA